MSRTAYYSPLMIGFGLGLLIPIMQVAHVYSLWGVGWQLAFIPLVLLNAALSGLACQLIMIGLQGLVAQVVPVFGGRSIRNVSAMAIGSLILIGMGLPWLLSLGFWLMKLTLTSWIWIILGVSLASLVGALILYVWSAPMAPRDFAED